MGKEQAHIQVAITLNLDTHFDVNDLKILPDQLDFVKNLIEDEVNEKMRSVSMTFDTFDTEYTIEEVLINGEYV